MRERAKQLRMEPKEASVAVLKAILDIAHVAIIGIDQKHNIILFNRGAERIFGYSADEVIGQPLDILLPPALSEMHRTRIREFAESATDTWMKGERREIPGRRKDGTMFPAEASFAKVSNDGQTIFVTILRDITEHKRVEEALYLDSQILASMADGVLLIRASDGVIIHANRQLEQMFGYGRGELISQHISMVNAPEEKAPDLKR